MKTSEKAYSLIRQFEGLRLMAYQCPAGVWTIGYGHTSGVAPGMVVTKEQAEEFLRQDISTAENIVNAECQSLRQCQFDAMVSFVFNIGGGNFRKSTLLKKSRLIRMTTQLLMSSCGGYIQKTLSCRDYRNADLRK